MRIDPDRAVLVVDDEEEIRQAATRVLGADGYTVHLSESAEEALQVLETKPIRLVITDHGLPGMTGLELLKVLRERHPHVGRMMMTGNADVATIVRSINEGQVMRFVRKPWDNAQLRVMVHFALQEVMLAEANRRLIDALGRQLQFLRSLEERFPGLCGSGADEELARILAEAELMRPEDA